MSARFLVGITDYAPAPAREEQRAFASADFEFLAELSAARRGEVLRKCDALLVWHEQIDSAYLQQAERCRIVVRYGVGFDNISAHAIREKNVPFCNTPDYGVDEVADTTCAMILALQRKLMQYDGLARRCPANWQSNTLAPLSRAHELYLGIVGVGRIGAAVMQRMRPFGYRLAGFDPYLPSGHEKALGYERCASLKELLALSDIVSVHCPDNEETHGLVDRTFLDGMKPGAILVNTARGGLFQDLDLILKYLKDKRLSGFGSDVLPHEPPSQGSALIAAWIANHADLAGRIIITPHTAFFSDQAWKEMRFKAAETAALYLERGIIRNRIY